MAEKNKDAMPQVSVVDGRRAIEVYEWQGYKLKEAEFRIGGFYRGKDNNFRFVFTETIKGIDAPSRLVATVDGKWYHLNKVATPARQMDLMYEVTEWARRAVRRAPMNATEIIEEHLKVDEPVSAPSPEPIVLTENDVVVDVDAEVESTVEVMEATPVDETVHVVVEEAPVKKKRKPRSDKGKPRPQMRKENRQ